MSGLRAIAKRTIRSARLRRGHVERILRRQRCLASSRTWALYHARELAMNRMEQEADELGADGIIGVRLVVNLDGDPQRIAFRRYRQWQDWAHEQGYPRRV